MDEGTIKTYHEHGINWMWYLRVEHHNDQTVTILAHYRVHKGDEGHPKTFDEYSLIEDKDRIVQKVRIGQFGKGYIEFDVRNKQHIFSYSFSK